MNALPEKPALIFRLNDNGQGPELLRQVFLEQGWTEYDEDVHDEHEWNLWWRTSRFRTGEYENIYPWQRLNHYPRSIAITKKDALARNLKRMRCVHGANVFNFSPLSFNLPNDYTKFVKAYSTLRQKPDGKTPLWIFKPADLSRGRGIFIFRDLSELLYDCNAVIQQYVDNPLLIGGYKFDLRIYVAVTSFHPLTVYIHEEGIARFGTEKFDLNSTKNVFAHLTNTSINKYSPGYTVDKERVGPGCKWTLSQLRHYFLGNNINDRMLWRRIINIIVLTLLIQAQQVPKTENCFELYGFDILVDENLKPWLLEVNFSPSLNSDCLADILAKKPMLHDLLYLMNFSSQDVERGNLEFMGNKNTSRGQAQQKGPSRLSAQHRKNSQECEAGCVNGCESTTSVLGISPRTYDEQRCGLGLPLVEPTYIQDEMEEDNLFGVGYQSSTEVTPRYSHDRCVHLSCPLSTAPPSLLPQRKFSLNAGLTAAGDQHVDADDILNRIISRSLGKGDMSPDFDFVRPRAKGLEKLHVTTTVSAESKSSTRSEGSKMSSTSGKSKLSKVSSDSGISSLSTDTGSNTKSQGEHVTHLRSLSRNKNNSRFGHHSGHLMPLMSVDKNSRDKFGVRSRSTVPTSRNDSQMSVRNPPHTSLHPQTSSLSMSISSSMKGLSGLDDNNNPIKTHSCNSVHSDASSASGRQRSQQLGGFHGRASAARGTKSSLSQYGQHHRNFQNKTHSLASLSNLRKKVGKFFLVFPFNEATWTTAIASLEAKVVIREMQQLLKESLTAVTGSKNGSTHDFLKAGESEFWGPLRPPKEGS